MSTGDLPRRALGRVASGLALLVLAACAVPTPYVPADDGFGYAEQQLENNRYRVSFAGNAATPRETVQNYLLYRAAELTVQSGHDHFTMAASNLERSTRYFGTVDPLFHRGFFGRHHDSFHHSGFGYSSFDAHPVDSYTAFADILVFEGEKPAGDVNAYDARDVLQRLEPMIVRTPA
jgi:hypothetical protein